MSRAMEIAERTLALVGTRAEAEVRATSGNLALTRFANSFIHQNVAEDGDTVSLRVSLDGRVASGTTTRTDPDALADFSDRILETAALQPVDEDWPGVAPPAATAGQGNADEVTLGAAPADRAERVKAFVDAGRGLSAAGYCMTTGSEVAFVNSAGQHAAGRFTEAVLDGIQQTDTSAGSGHAASNRLGDLDGTSVGDLATRRALDSADTFDLKPGEYEVILAPECVATIGVFLAVYGFNAKLHEEQQSFAELGVTQFDESLSIYDDPTDPRAIGVPFDTEGTPSRRLDMIRDGVTTGLTFNRRTARKAGVVSTGHHSPWSAVYGPIAGNIFIDPGGGTIDELIASVERGLYVSTFNYCRVLEPKTMVVTGLTRNGTFLIENGKITGAVSNLRFTQSFLTALAPGQLLGIGDDARFADSEFGTGMLHGPSMRLAGWNFTGGTDG